MQRFYLKIEQIQIFQTKHTNSLMCARYFSSLCTAVPIIKKLQVLLSPYALRAPNDYFLSTFLRQNVPRNRAVARKSCPTSNFAPSDNWNILPSRKILSYLLNKSFSLVLYQKSSFATRIPSFTAMTTSNSCGRHVVFPI